MVLAVWLAGSPGPLGRLGAQAAEPAPGNATPGKAAPAADAQAALDAMGELRRKTLALDIAVSTWYELRDMCLRYGLLESAAADAATTPGAAQLREKLYAFFGIAPPAKAPGESAVVVERSSAFDYIDLGDAEDSILALSGGVRITVATPDGFTHRLEAEELRYDRAENAVSARGDVRYERTGNGRSDRFTGGSLAVDLDDYSGVFLDGGFDMEPVQGSDARTTRLSADRVIRRNDELVLFEAAVATACDEPDPHYSLRARKLWLLGSGDWAIQNAVLYIGTVPVLWLPFYYYPSEELVFHPVFGVRSREGSFLQTSTYLIGRRPDRQSTSGMFSVVQRQDGQEAATELTGLFLRRVARVPGAAGSGSTPASRRMLRVIADAYTSLGALVGVEGSFPSRTGTLDFSVSASASRSLFLESTGLYSPFDYAGSYESVWNNSNLDGIELPFRYGLSFTYRNRWSVPGADLSASLSVPLYADPYYEQDFLYRLPDRSWLDMLIGGKEETTKPSKRSLLAQNLTLSGSFNPQGPASQAIPRIQLSKLSSALSWRVRPQPTTGLGTVARRLLAADPARDFFYPDTLTLFDGNGGISGTLLSSEPAPPRAASAGADADTNAGTDADTEVAANAAANATADAGTADVTDPGDAAAANPRDATAADPGAEEARAGSGAVFLLGWRANGSALGEQKFDSAAWTNPDSIDWKPYYTLFSWRGSVALESRLGTRNGLAEFLSTLQMSAQDQRRPLFNDERIAPVTVHPYLISDYGYRQSVLDSTASFALRPFAAPSLWSPTGISWNIAPRWLKTSYAGLDGTGISAAPRYSTTYFSWTPESVPTHLLDLHVGVRPLGYTQKLSFKVALPPLQENLGLTLDLESKPARLSVSGTYGRTSPTAVSKPLSLTARLSAGKSPGPNFQSDFAWDFDADAPLSSVTSLGYGPLSATYTMRKARGYAFSGGGWISDGTEGFRPYEAKASFRPRIKALGATAAITASQNLVRFTESSIQAEFGAKFTLPEGFSLSVTGVSSNASAWRYWTGLLPAVSGIDPDNYRKNFFMDLWDSLAVWDRDALERGSFKLRSFSLQAAQELHDWNLSASLAVKPLLYDPPSGRPYYRMDVSFSLGVTWKDIPEVATKVSYTEGAFVE